LACLGHPNKFQRVSRLAFVTAATSLTGCHLNSAQCAQYLAVSCAAIHYIYIFRGRGGALAPDRVLPCAKFTSVQILRFRILAAFLHGTPAAGVSQTLRRGTSNGTTKLSQRAPPIFERAAITLGISPHCSSKYIDVAFVLGQVTVRRMLYRNVVCPVCLSVTLVYCGQTVGSIKMSLGTEVGLGQGHIALDGDPAPARKGA